MDAGEPGIRPIATDRRIRWPAVLTGPETFSIW
jgi:hypothetical protein